MERKTCAKFVSLKASYPLVRSTTVPNLERKNKTVFIPDKAQKENLPPYQHKVCAPI
jgi:hypothetical protein